MKKKNDRICIFCGEQFNCNNDCNVAGWIKDKNGCGCPKCACANIRNKSNIYYNSNMKIKEELLNCSRMKEALKLLKHSKETFVFR